MNEPASDVSSGRTGADGSDLRFAMLTSLALLVTHAIAFFLHEYAHAVTAWLLGLKDHPLAIEYGHLSLSNVLLQQEISENVDYDQIFADGHGFSAAMIALAGPGIGNGLLYLVCAVVLASKASSMRPSHVFGLFWLAVMACGNLWSYAPVRTIATHGDMGIAAEGLGISSWTLLPFVVLPSAWAAWHLFSHVLPLVLDKACGSDLRRRTFVTATTCFVFFGFFGSPAIGGDYGDVSAVFSIASLFVLFPLVLMRTLPAMPRSSTAEAAGRR